MKQLLILSGKGGSGKTTVASAFIRLSQAKAFADCDVEAPNLHLIMTENDNPIRNPYFDLPKAKINTDDCISCGRCQQSCRFNAISFDDDGYVVNPYACEGCSVCEYICPVKAIQMTPLPAGELALYNDDKHVFSTAQLKIGSGTSGKLVTEVKKQMYDTSKPTELAIIDGSPGIGCPVIASITGVDMVLIVAEPSLSGISDMERIIKTARNFNIKTAVCVNKYDTNLEHTEKIETYCHEHHLPFTGKIPFDSEAVKAINTGKTIVDINCPSGNATKDIYSKTIDMLFA